MKLEWMLSAMNDRDAIFTFVEADNFAAAVRLDDLFETEAESLLRFQHRGKPGRISGTYELVVPGERYILAYELGTDSIRIHRVLHGAQQWPD